MLETQFTEIVSLIKKSRTNAIKAVNKELIDLYWSIGEYIDKRISNFDWGQSVVKQLAEYFQLNEPHLKGFSDKNLWGMRQFYQDYEDAPKLLSLLRGISWSHNLAIFSRCKTLAEKEFYLRLCKKEP